MKIHQSVLSGHRSAADALRACADIDPSLVLVFGALERFGDPGLPGELRAAFPRALLVGCSTAGEISSDGVDDNTLNVTAVRFERAAVRYAEARLADAEDSFEAGRRLGEQLAAPDLDSALVFAPGVDINGSALIDGVQAAVGPAVRLSGGLAGGAGGFERTLVLGGCGVSERGIVAVGFDRRARVSHGGAGGWAPFGPKRKVTQARGNVLSELDGRPALELYRTYLGEYASGLPAAGLLFPFRMLRGDTGGTGLIRTILGVDDAAGALVLAGDVDPQGQLQLMQASTDALVEGAHQAALMALDPKSGTCGQSLLLLVSCVGRKLVMGGRVEEEVDAVREVFDRGAVLTGFYSHGEISPRQGAAGCDLHNQTMTITCIQECDEV